MNSKISIQEYLPQKFPFQMVDCLVELKNGFAQTELEIIAENVLVTNNIFSVGGMLENVAQSVAAGFGYQKTIENLPIEKGYIGAIKNVKIFKQPIVGDTISTKITIVNSFGNAQIVQGEIFLQNELIAECELSIFVN